MTNYKNDFPCINYSPAGKKWAGRDIYLGSGKTRHLFPAPLPRQIIVGWLVRSRCVCFDKDEIRKDTRAGAQEPEAIVSDPVKGELSKSIHSLRPASHCCTSSFQWTVN